MALAEAFRQRDYAKALALLPEKPTPPLQPDRVEANRALLEHLCLQRSAADFARLLQEKEEKKASYAVEHSALTVNLALIGDPSLCWARLKPLLLNAESLPCGCGAQCARSSCGSLRARR